MEAVSSSWDQVDVYGSTDNIIEEMETLAMLEDAKQAAMLAASGTSRR